MTLTTAPKSASEPTGASTSPGGRLWQVPVFLIGVTALVMVVMNRSCSKEGQHRHLIKEINEARHLIDQAEPHSLPDPNQRRRYEEEERNRLAKAISLLNKVLEHSEKVGKQLGEAYLILGTAKLRLADRGESAGAGALYKEARENLLKANELKVSADDEPALRFRLAKADYHTGNDPAHVIERLDKEKDGADDNERADAYHLLTQAYMRLQPPNYSAARKVNDDLRGRVSPAPERVLMPARLLGGELLLKLHRPEEARAVLLGVAAPAEKVLQARARLLLAQCYQAEQHWAEAVNKWREVKPDLSANDPERGKALFDMGFCEQKLNLVDPATRTWEECRNTSTGEPAQAATLCLAEIYRQAGKCDQCLTLVKLAVADTARPENWNNSLFTLPRLRDLFESASQSFRKAGKFDLAAELVAQYRRVAEPARLPAIEAETKADYGRSMRAQARTIQNLEERKRAEVSASLMLGQAGQAYVQTAALPGQSAEQQANLLWLACACFREVPDNYQVIAILRQFLEMNNLHWDPEHPRKHWDPEKKKDVFEYFSSEGVNKKEDRLGEALYLLAETLRLNKNYGDANKTYDECEWLFNTAPFALRARFRQAMLSLEQEPDKWDKATDMLVQNVQLIHGNTGDSDPEAMEKTLYALGGLWFQKGKYKEAIPSLEEATEQYKNSPDFVRALFQLAESYRQNAVQINLANLQSKAIELQTEKQNIEEYRRWIAKALDKYRELVELLDRPEAQGILTEEENTKARFMQADCQFYLGKYEEALKCYEDLIERYKLRTERVNALGGTVRCLFALGREEKKNMRMEEIRQALPSLPEPLRKEWEKWVNEASMPVQDKPTNRS